MSAPRENQPSCGANGGGHGAEFSGREYRAKSSPLVLYRHAATIWVRACKAESVSLATSGSLKTRAAVLLSPTMLAWAARSRRSASRKRTASTTTTAVPASSRAMAVVPTVSSSSFCLIGAFRSMRPRGVHAESRTPTIPVTSSRMPGHTVPGRETLFNRAHQRLPGKRLGQDGAGALRAESALLEIERIAGDEHDGNRSIGACQRARERNSVH